MPEGEKEMQSHEALKLRSHDPLILADLVIAAEKATQATYSPDEAGLCNCRLTSFN